VSNPAARPANQAPATVVTLWRCSKCSSFISVESINPVSVVICPACQHASLVLRGSFNHVLDLRSEDDTCCDFYPNGW
jgi:DNA-directed RNA polymerase subunit RPC12/RpoP